MRSPLRLAVGAVALLAVTLAGWVASVNVARARDNDRWKKVRSDLARLGTSLEVQAGESRPYPVKGSTTVEAALPFLRPGDPGTPLPTRDPWGHAYVLLVFRNGESYLLASPGRDGLFEKEPGGAFVRDDPDRDVVFVEGAFFQYPEGYQCDCSAAEIARLVEESRAQARTRWLSPEMAELRELWKSLPGR